jgi:hypothetical protein
VKAPENIKAGETAVVKLTLAVPENAKDSYSGSLDLQIDDPDQQRRLGSFKLPHSSGS